MLACNITFNFALMDYRLDLFNAINEYVKNSTDDDVLFVFAHNKADGECFHALVGDWELMSAAFSAEGYINFTEGTRDNFDNTKAALINTALNICANDEDIKNKFLKALK